MQIAPQLRACILLGFQVLGLACPSYAEPRPVEVSYAAPLPGSPELESWAKAQAIRSADMLAAQQLDNGAVLASPSQREPNYYFHWTRDAALVMTTQLLELTKKEQSARSLQLLARIADYLRFSKSTQEVPNQSGGVEDLLNLGEPKFHVDASAYDGPWGRPQSDGPALRALFILKLAKLAMAHAWIAAELQRLDIRLTMDEVLRRDLAYTLAHWRAPSFDLWEEVRGSHFYNRLVQYRALVDGAAYLRAEGQSALGRAYGDAATAIAASLERFWSSEHGYLLATLERSGGIDDKRQNLDIAIVLAALHAADPLDPFFAPTDDRVLATAARLSESFSAAYPINRITRDPSGHAMAPGIGRYPEDRYDGVGSSVGHAWFLTTLAMAELHYRVAKQLADTGSLALTERNLPFYQRALGAPSVALSRGAVLDRRDPAFLALMTRLRETADAYLARVRYHSGRNGAMSEQFSRYDGFMRGARDLTWSYAALVSAVAARTP